MLPVAVSSNLSPGGAMRVHRGPALLILVVVTVTPVTPCNRHSATQSQQSLSSISSDCLCHRAVLIVSLSNCQRHVSTVNIVAHGAWCRLLLNAASQLVPVTVKQE